MRNAHERREFRRISRGGACADCNRAMPGLQGRPEGVVEFGFGHGGILASTHALISEKS
jgi:hypothetical protein